MAVTTRRVGIAQARTPVAPVRRRPQVWQDQKVGRPLHEQLQQIGMVLCGLMAYSGQVKQIPLFSIIPIDFTVAVTIVAFGVAVAFNVTGGRFVIGRPALVGALLLAMSLFGALTRVDTFYGADKVVRLFAVAMPAVLVTVLLVRDIRDLARLLRVMFVVSVGLSIWIVVGGVREFDQSAGRLTSSAGSTISFGQANGFVLTCIVGWMLVTRRLQARNLAIVGGLVAFHIWTILAIGSRGPIQAFVVATIAMIVFQVRGVDRQLIKRAGIMIGLSSALLYVVWSNVPEQSRERVLLLASGNSADIRFEGWAWTWKNLEMAPIGGGWGSWTRDTTLNLSYPHNIIFEAWYEAGLLGLIVLLAALWTTLRHQYRILAVDKMTATIMFGAIIFWLTAALVSADVNSNKPLYVLMTAGAAATYHRRSNADGRSLRYRASGRPLAQPRRLG